MSEIGKIQRYIDLTGKKYPDGTPYQMNINELFALSHLAEKDVAGAIYLAFEYGRAKGYRAAKKEAQI